MRRSVLVEDKKGNVIGRARLGLAASSAATAALSSGELRRKTVEVDTSHSLGAKLEAMARDAGVWGGSRPRAAGRGWS